MQQSQEAKIVEAHSESMAWIQDKTWHIFADALDGLAEEFEFIKVAWDHQVYRDVVLGIILWIRLFLVYSLSSLYGFVAMLTISGLATLWCTMLSMTRVMNEFINVLIPVPALRNRRQPPPAAPDDSDDPLVFPVD